MPNLVLIDAAVYRLFMKQKCDGRDYIIFKMAAMAAILDFPKWSKSVVVGPKHVHAKFCVDWSSGVPSIEETKV